MNNQHSKINFKNPAIVKTEIPEGGFILQSKEELGSYPDNICQHLIYWTKNAPERLFLADRYSLDGSWRKITFKETLCSVRTLAQSLRDMGAAPSRPVVILSDNSIENGLLLLAAMYIGVPAVPISPAYSLISQDHAKLKYIIDQVQPDIVFAQDGNLFENALSSIDHHDFKLICGTNTPRGAVPFDTLMDNTISDKVEEAFANTGPDTIAKILYTSGSTGLPKGVLNTQKMMCSNQQMIAQVWPFLEEVPPVILDWLPWNHTFGGNHNFNMILRNGGTLYIDNGKPAPHLIQNTINNMQEISPTMSFNVPRGYEMLLPALEENENLRNSFFKNLQLIFDAAAALPQNVWERLEALSMKARGEIVTMASSWGSTETAPVATAVHFQIKKAGVIGVPVPGTKLKMIPNGTKLEMRVKGPNVMPGYFKNPEKTSSAFDEEGYYLIEDAGRLEDPSDPNKGVVFDGRTTEDFKLNSGTWVAVGNLRTKSIEAASSVIQDAVVTGHNRDHVGLLIFPNEQGIRKLCQDDQSPITDLIKRPETISALKEGLDHHNQQNPASSTYIKAAILLTEQPSIDANEITDKGYINQQAVLERRHAYVEKLYTPNSDCIWF